MLIPTLPRGIRTLFISSATGQGLMELKDRLVAMIELDSPSEE
jgi:hypothetical protein